MNHIGYLISIMRYGLEELEAASQEGDGASMLSAMDIIARGYYDLEEELGWERVDVERIECTDPD